MDTEEKNETNRDIAQNEKESIKAPKETLNTTDPQEHMEGPLSSLMHKAGETIKGDGEGNDSSKQ